MKGAIISAVIVLIAIFVMAEHGQASIDCNKVDGYLAPCVSYLTSGTPPSEDCCKGVQNIKDISVNTDAKRQACECVKAAAAKYPNLKDEVAQALPKMCKIMLDIPISRNTNCQAIV